MSLARRSAYLLSGSARNVWEHSIAPLDEHSPFDNAPHLGFIPIGVISARRPARRETPPVRHPNASEFPRCGKRAWTPHGSGSPDSAFQTVRRGRPCAGWRRSPQARAWRGWRADSPEMSEVNRKITSASAPEPSETVTSDVRRLISAMTAAAITSHSTAKAPASSRCRKRSHNSSCLDGRSCRPRARTRTRWTCAARNRDGP